MINRRRFLTYVATLGLSTALPLHVLAQRTAERPQTLPAQAPVYHPDLSPPLVGVEGIERLENLLDDLNCVEVAVNDHQSWCEGVSGQEGGELQFNMYCPLVNHRSDDPTMTVSPSSYWCIGCQAGGTAVDLYQRRQGISYGQAMNELQRFLETGEFKGRRPEQHHQWHLLQETTDFYHDMLWTRPEGEPARTWLREQGITGETVTRFQLGYAPSTPTACLAQHLLSLGHRENELTLICDRSEQTGQLMDRYGSDQLVLPITDWHGRYWGFFQWPLRHDPGPRGSCIQTTSDLSPRRLRRLLFSAPPDPQRPSSDSILVTRDAWDVVAFHSAGMPDVAYWLMNGCASDTTYAVRTTLARASTIVYPWHADTASLERLCALTGPYAERLRLLALPDDGRLLELLNEAGTNGVRSAVAAAIPVTQWLSS